MAKLKLKDVLFEITNKCNKDCSYCGSKGLSSLGDGLSHDETIAACKTIAAMGPEVVTFTGGEPTCIIGTLLEGSKTLKAVGVKSVGVVTNGIRDLDLLVKCDSLDTIGLSINTVEDVNALRDRIKSGDSYMADQIKDGGKITIITNFGTHNIFNFNELHKFVSEFNGFWQIQLTMGEYQLPKAGIATLYGLIRDNLLGDVNMGYILSDNLQFEHECCAGISSMAVDYKGQVLSCLSKRAWCPSIQMEGDIQTPGIWQNSFKRERFTDCDHCRSRIDYPEMEAWEKFTILKKRGETHTVPHRPAPAVKAAAVVPRIWKTPINAGRRPDFPGNIVLYAVQKEPMAWPTFPDPDPIRDDHPQVYSYAVVSPAYGRAVCHEV